MSTGRKTGMGMLAIGDELAEGRILNENQRWLARRFGRVLCVTAADDHQEVISALRYLNRCRAVIVSGGLGPTADDRTREFVCRWLGCELILHLPTLRSITKRIERKSARRMTPNNRLQALYPAGSRPLRNATGGAVGFRFVKNGTTYYFFPGVPSEFQAMVGDHVSDRWSGRLKNGTKMFRFSGIPESTLDAVLQSSLPHSLKSRYGIYPSVRGVEVILRHAHPVARSQFRRTVLARLGDYLVSEGCRSPEEILLDLLQKRRLKLATAESCTAGMFSSTLAGIPGASSVLVGGICAYDNRVKTSELGVSSQILNRHGAVSAACAREMAVAALRKFGGDVSISITGIAGPSGGTPGKPVGTVYFGFAFSRRAGVRPAVQTIQACFSGSRNDVRKKSVYFGIYRILGLLKK